MSASASRAETLAVSLPANGLQVNSLPVSSLPVSSMMSAAMRAAIDTPTAASGGTIDGAGAAVEQPVLLTTSVEQPGNASAPGPIESAVPSGAAIVANTNANTNTMATPAGKHVTATTAAAAGKAGTVAQLGTAPPQSPATAGSIGGAVFALVLVIGLILALAWLARRMPGFRGAGGTPSLRVVSSLALGPRERVVVVAVGNTQLLLGVGAGGTRTLHTLTEPLPVATPATPPAFAQLLAQHFGKKA